MNHVQAVTVLEASTPENKRTSVTNNINNNITVKRNVYKDSNNNVQQKTKESLNVVSKSSTEDETQQEYKLLGLITFKSPIKWLNSISIILIHLIFIYAFITYPLQGKILTTLWGELPFFLLFTYDVIYVTYVYTSLRCLKITFLLIHYERARKKNEIFLFNF